MFGTSGIRGHVGEEVTAELALSVGRALGVDCDRVVVGRDPRESGHLLADALAAGLRETGTDVDDLGRAATPTIARSVDWRDADAGVSVTASHNPPPDNGLKLWTPTGLAFDREGRERIERRVREGSFDLRPWDGLGEREPWQGATTRHVEALVDAVEIDDPPSVVVDLGNGVGGVTVEALVSLGCETETLNAGPDGRFPGRPSEPTAEHCGSLCAVVGETDADLGIAHDGDADRTMAVTGDGEFVPGDVLLAMFAGAAAGNGDTVAVPVNTSLAVDDALAERGVSVARTRVGDVFVAERAADPGVAFGGEPSGAWIWPGETLCPDGPLAACRLVELAAERPLVDRVAEIETYPIRRESVRVDDKGAVMARVRDEITDRFGEVSTLDGVRVDVDGGWFLVRASGTQPLVRVTAEARTESRANEIFEEAGAIVAGARE